MKIERISYQGWANSIQLSNRDVDLVVTAAVGPRVIRFGFRGEENEFYEAGDQLGLTGGDDWRLYGGHRLWVAPETRPNTYFADNFEVKVEDLGEVVRFTPPPETSNRIQKSMDISLADDGAKVRLTQRVQNIGPLGARLAIWGITAMKAGGVAILPLPERHEFGHNLQPDCSVSIWNYTDMADPRFTWGRRFIMLRQDSSIASPQKIGLAATDGWAACARGGHLFIKQFGFDPAGEYPDRGCNLESYCDGNLIELESLGALVTLKPGQAVEYGETWTLLRGIPQPRTEVDVERMALPEVKIMQNPIIV